MLCCAVLAAKGEGGEAPSFVLVSVFAAQHSKPVCLLAAASAVQMDIEGFEPSVMRGARDLLLQVRPIIGGLMSACET